MAADNEKILSFVRAHGPIIPVQLAKHIGTNILFASAMLGELASKGLLKISHVKVGGTPLYYLPGQEHKLQNYSKNLHEKEQRAYELLKQQGVLQDSKQDPVIRAALRNIKDYAVPLEVTTSATEPPQLFWKWYLLSNSEAEEKIRKLLGIGNPPEQQTPAEAPEQPMEEPQKETRTPIKRDEPAPEQPEQKTPKHTESKQEKTTTHQSDDFIKSIYLFFRKKSITVRDEKIVRKGSDAEFVVEIPSPVGNLRYFVKAKSKKNSNDSDISAAFLQGQRKNLPTIYLTTGKVTNKAKKSAEKDFPSMLIIELSEGD
ncbi:hypothetical protein D6764_02780 [Candidatus Woesearchaeota archaeon]|nr:MAG: hypothetical protein D6764_02780 [Candidatus Woesearchaeota archaeon]